MSIELSDEVIKTFCACGAPKTGPAQVNSLSFSDDYRSLIAIADDDSVHWINIQTGNRDKLLFNTGYNIGNAEFTHHPNAFLCSSAHGTNFFIKYWSAHDNRIIHNFKGHTDQVSALDMNPRSDMFISSGSDRTLFLWELRMRRQIAQMNLTEAAAAPICAFDPLGIIFAVVYPRGQSQNVLKLISCAEYSRGPFLERELSCFTVTGMEFSDDGLLLLLYTNANEIVLLDALTGESIDRSIRAYTNNSGKVKAVLSPDSKYVVTGCEQGKSILFFDIKNQNKVWELPCAGNPPLSLAWSREHALLVSASEEVVLWLPGTPTNGS